MSWVSDVADLGKNALDLMIDKGKDLIEGATDTVSNVFEGVKEAADSVLHPIDTLLGNWGKDLLEGSMNMANKTTFDIPNITFISTMTNVFVFVTTTFAICIVLYKVIEAQIQASNGSGEPLTANIIQRLFYSATALGVLPVAMNFFIKDVISPIGEYAIEQVMDQLDSEIIGERIRNFLISNYFTGGVSAIVLFIFLIFFAFSIAMYFISICIFYADFLVLTMLTPLVAMSLLTDEQNYFQIWIKELLAQSITMLVKLILYAGLIVLLVSEKYTTEKFMSMIGLGLVIIKTPSALQNMWYSTKVSKGGNLGSLAMLIGNLKK